MVAPCLVAAYGRIFLFPAEAELARQAQRSATARRRDNTAKSS
jgi:hypothetical protein